MKRLSLLVIVPFLFLGCDQNALPIRYTTSEKLEQQQTLIDQLSKSLQEYKTRLALLERSLNLTYIEEHTQTSIMEVWIGESQKESSIKIVNTPAHYSNQEVAPRENLFKATTYYAYEYEKGKGAKKNVSTSWSYLDGDRWVDISTTELKWLNVPESVVQQIEQ